MTALALPSITGHRTFPRLWALLVLAIGLALPNGHASAAGLVLKDVVGVLSDGGRFDGNLRITQFGLQQVGDGAVLTVEGVLKGTAKLADGTTRDVDTRFTAPVDLTKVGPDVGRRVCTILDLDIGAIHLNLLGLVIDIAPIHIDITAVPGGGLLGDLLCSLANLLDGLPTLDDINRLIRRINKLLESL